MRDQRDPVQLLQKDIQRVVGNKQSHILPLSIIVLIFRVNYCISSQWLELRTILSDNTSISVC